MAMMTTLNTAERLAPRGLHTAEGIGSMTIALAIWLIAPEMDSLIR
jgi:hypothetical protein